MAAGNYEETQVVVVGAGPAGLLLAGELRLAGVEVVVVERLAEPTGESRASQLNARTMEILDQRGLLSRLGELQSEGKGHFGGLPLDVSGVPSVHAGYWKVPQFRTEKMLQEWAAELGADIRRGHELRALRTTSDHVEAEITGPAGTLRLRARYLVGCDGEQSTVRRLADIDFPGTSSTRELIRADVAGIDIPARRFERFDAGLAIAARRPDGVTRVMFHTFGETSRSRTSAPGFPEVVSAWARITGEDISGGTPLWVDVFGDANRQASRYRRLGRILVAGDAAHAQMPAGGQALNLGLQDVMNLGWKLAARVHGTASDGLLDTYHDERHPVGARVLANVQAQAHLLLGGPDVDGVRDVFGELLGLEAVREHLAVMLSGLDIRYPSGPGEHPLLGARLPHAELEIDAAPAGTTALLHAAKGILLSLSERFADDAEIQAVAAKWSDRVRLVTASATPGGVLSDVGAVLVRPDGHVAWIDGGATELHAALHRWFGEAESMNQTGFQSEGMETMGKLTNKTALVTGSSRGIGRGIAERLGRDGAIVAVHYTANSDAAEQTVKTIKAEGGQAFTVQAELGVPGDVDKLFAGLVAGLEEHAGTTNLDILVNNAGIMGGVAPEDITPEIFDKLIAVNTKAPLFIVQRALSIMPDGGRIINISSGLTRVANPQEIAYAMTKGAVEMIGLHFARHLGTRGITVNSVAPGVTNNGNPIFDVPEAMEQMSQLSAFGRVGEPRDIADVVAFLASDDARWVTGAFIDASGGSLLG